MPDLYFYQQEVTIGENGQMIYGPVVTVKQIAMKPAPGVKPKPEPQPPDPTEPPLGFWGPNDPRPTLPIAGWDPGSGTWPKPPAGTPPGTQVALVAPVPPPADGSPPPTPPVLAADAKAMSVRLASGETFTMWGNPYPTTGPV